MIRPPYLTAFGCMSTGFGRGLSHATFHYDEWDKDVAPSTELREWYHADPAGRWDEFARRYRAELDANPAAKSLAVQIKDKPTVTLLFSSRELDHNNATVLRAWLLSALQDYQVVKNS